MTYHTSKLEHVMREVHKNIPSTVKKADVSGMKKEAMLRAIAFSKARKKGWKNSDTGKTKI